MSTQPPLDACPFCRNNFDNKTKTLYGHRVCSKCYYAFANRRQMAFFIDRVLWIIPNLAIGFMFGLAVAYSGSTLTPQSKSMINLISWPLFLVFLFKDGFRGYSPGKLLCGVQTIDRTSLAPIGFGASFKRNLPLLIPFVPLLVAFQLCSGKRLGDGWSNSMVIWKKYEKSHVFGNVGFCEACHYDLRGNTSGTCPECGTPLSEVNRGYLSTAVPAPPSDLQSDHQQ